MDVPIECIMKEKVDNLSRYTPVQGELVNYSGRAPLKVRFRFRLAEFHRNFFSCQYFTFKIATISKCCIENFYLRKTYLYVMSAKHFSSKGTLFRYLKLIANKRTFIL